MNIKDYLKKKHAKPKKGGKKGGNSKKQSKNRNHDS